MTSSTIIDGKVAAETVIAGVKTRAAALQARSGVRPGLAVVIVGEDPASQVYVGSKGRMAENCGFHSIKHALPADTSEADLLALVADLNADPAIHGILLQLPLPAPLDPLPIIRTIAPEKDVDGLNEVNAGRVALGDFSRAFVPCTPAGAMVLLRSVMPVLRGKQAVVIGRSNLVGKPIAALLLAADCTVTMAHSRTLDLPPLCRSADVLVAAVGRPEMVKADWIKPGAVVIDVGINRVPAPDKGDGKTRLVGDVDYAGAMGVAAAVTPVPGGVGPMTIAMLMENTLTAATRAAG